MAPPDPNAKVEILTGDPSSDDTWGLRVDGYLIRVVVRDGQVTDTMFAEAFAGYPDNGNILLRTAEVAVLDAIEFHDTCKGFGNHPDVVM